MFYSVVFVISDQVDAAEISPRSRTLGVPLHPAEVILVDEMLSGTGFSSVCVSSGRYTALQW